MKLWTLAAMSAFIWSAVSSASPTTTDRFVVKDWAQSLKTALEDKNTKAIAQLLDMDRIENTTLAHRETPDRKALEKARDLFAKEKFAEALSFYNQVGKESDFWLEAVEEKGWTYLRMHQPEKSLAQTKTLTNEIFSPVVGSEPYFLQSLSELKICDYKDVLETHRDFKKTQRARIVQMQTLVDHGLTSAQGNDLVKSDSFPMTLSDVKEEAKTLPRLFYRDQQLQKALLRIKMAEEGEPVLQAAIAKGAPGSAALQRIVQKLESNRQSAKTLLNQRVKALAQTETNENFKILQKLNLVEVETIQRIHTDQGADKKTYQKTAEVKAGPNDLVFNDDGNPWIDELDKYQMQVSVCPQNTRRKM